MADLQAVTDQDFAQEIEGDDVGYIRLTTFNEQTNAVMREEVAKLRTEGPSGCKRFWRGRVSARGVVVRG